LESIDLDKILSDGYAFPDRNEFPQLVRRVSDQGGYRSSFTERLNGVSKMSAPHRLGSCLDGLAFATAETAKIDKNNKGSNMKNYICCACFWHSSCPQSLR
jgi:hypothetical protein